MDIVEARLRFKPAVTQIVEQCSVTEDFVDRERFRVTIATVWGNAVLEPQKSGIVESDLPVLHDFLNEEIEKILGEGQSITSCYEYLMSRQGEECLERLQIGARHREFLQYFGRLILSQTS
ncbi:MAG: hypothetical protein KDI19_10475 [Pseudomonadales bacterium]|nr:hypothetical protein [Pseudomonadales bacterium]